MTRSILMVLLPTLALSQPMRKLSIDEAVRTGLQSNRQLRIAEAKTDAAEARSDEVNAARLPSLKLLAGYSRLSDVEPFSVRLPSSTTSFVLSPTLLDQYTSRLSLQQPLFTGFRLENAAAAADYSAEASHFDFQRDRTAVGYTIRAAYWNAYKTREVKRAMDENVAQIRAHLADARNLLTQGLATGSDVLKVEVQLSAVQLAQIEAANNVLNATMALNNLIGFPLDTEIELTSSPTFGECSQPPIDTLAQQALASRADLKSAELRLNAADATVTAAKGGWWPQITLLANAYYSQPNPRIMPAKNEFTSTWDVGLTMSWDIWNWGSTKKQAEQATAAQTQIRYGLEQLRENVSLEVNQSYRSLLQSREKIGVAAKAVEQAEESHRLTRSRFAQGAATNTDLLDAEIALLQAKLSQTASLVEYELADAQLIHVIGKGERP